jgi:hypothetical protein
MICIVFLELFTLHSGYRTEDVRRSSSVVFVVVPGEQTWLFVELDLGSCCASASCSSLDCTRLTLRLMLQLHAAAACCHPAVMENVLTPAAPLSRVQTVLPAQR